MAVIQAGYSFRTRVTPDQAGTIAVIQMKELTRENVVDCTTAVKMRMDELDAKHLIQVGDLVFRSRGMNLTAAVVRDDPGRAVVIAPLLRIRPDRERVLPEYLCFAINSPLTQGYLSAHAKGSALKMIGKQTLEKMEIPLPSIERQREVVELAAMGEREQTLLARISKLRRQLANGWLTRLAEGDG